MKKNEKEIREGVHCTTQKINEYTRNKIRKYKEKGGKRNAQMIKRKGDEERKRKNINEENE